MKTDSQTESGPQGNAGQEGTSLDKAILEAFDGISDDDANFVPATNEAENEEIETTSPDKTDELAQATEGEESDKADILTAPEHWSAAYKETFDTLPPAAKKAWLDQAKDFERGMTKNAEKNAEIRKNWEAVDTKLKAFDSYIGQMGVSKADFMNQIVDGFTFLQRDPKNFIQWAMQQYNVKPDDFIQGSTKPADKPTYVDPTVKKVQEQYDELNRRYVTIEQAMMQTHQAAQLDKATAFLANAASEKDEAGNLLYPHFDDELAMDMQQIIESTPVFGSINDPMQKFKMAYDLAVGRNQAKFIEKETAKRLAAQEAERSKNARTIKPQPGAGGAAPTGKRSLDEILNDVFEQKGI